MVFQQSGVTMIISKKTCQRVNSIVEAALSRLPAGKFQNFYEKHNLVRISSLIDYSLQAQYYPDGSIILDTCLWQRLSLDGRKASSNGNVPLLKPFWN